MKKSNKEQAAFWELRVLDVEDRILFLNEAAALFEASTA